MIHRVIAMKLKSRNIRVLLIRALSLLLTSSVLFMIAPEPVFAHASVSGSGQKVSSTAKADKSKKVPSSKDISAEAMHEFIRLKIASCTTKDMDVQQKLYACYMYCLNNMKYKRSYEPGNGSMIKDYALEAFYTGRGNCYRYASMFAYMASELGFSATVHSGQCISTEGTWTPHSWCVIILPTGEELIYDLSFGDANLGKKNYYGIRENEHDRVLWTQEIWIPIF